MRSGKSRSIYWAVWLSLAALAFNSLVPIHLAFDLSEAFEHRGHETGDHESHDLEWRLLARAVGHFSHHRHHSGGHPHSSCPVCAAVGTLATFVPAAGTSLAAPALIAEPLLTGTVASGPDFALTLAYRSRAPPLS